MLKIRKISAEPWPEKMRRELEKEPNIKAYNIYELSEIISVLGISAKIKLVAPKTIPRSEGKAKRVVDKREL